MGWVKRWLITITTRTPPVTRLYMQDRQRFAAWFSDGIMALFGDTDNFLQPGRVFVKPVGQAGNRRTQPTDTITTPEEAVAGSRVRYTVEVGPNNRILHAHVFVEVRLHGNSNVLLRMFKAPAGNPWTLENEGWWADWWGAPANAGNGVPNHVNAFRGRQLAGGYSYTYAGLFGFHVQTVRPRDPNNDDIMHYLSKTLHPPTPAPLRSRTRGQNRRMFNQHQHPQSGRVIPDGQVVGEGEV